MIVLASPKSQGDFHATDCTHAKVVQYSHTAHLDEEGEQTYTIRFTWAYGYLVGGVFTKGVYPSSAPIVLTGDELNPIFGLMGRTDENAKDHMARGTYTWMVDNIAELAGGTVEEA